jgi:O-antigen ligase
MPSFPQSLSAATLGKAPRLSVALLGLSVPISVALDNLLLLLPLIWLLFNFRMAASIAWTHPVARAAWLLFAALLVGTIYGSTALHTALGLLGKYADLALIPAFMLLLGDAATRRLAENAFIGAMAITLLVSISVGLGWVPVPPWMDVRFAIEDPAIFHSRITQNNMMAFAVFLALLRMRETASAASRAGWGVFALLGTLNVLFMVQGRTGYLILLTLLAWFAWSTLAREMRRRDKALGLRHLAAVLLTLATVASAAYQISPRLHERVQMVATDLQAWQPNRADLSSTGQRLDFYYNTLQVVQGQPLFGAGTGGFAEAYRAQVEGTVTRPTQNPHNEYLMIAAQTGLVGLALLLYLFYTLWRTAPRLPTAFEQDAARGLVLAYLVNCTLNSALLDHSDGLFFAFMVAVLFANFKTETKRD